MGSFPPSVRAPRRPVATASASVLLLACGATTGPPGQGPTDTTTGTSATAATAGDASGGDATATGPSTTSTSGDATGTGGSSGTAGGDGTSVPYRGVNLAGAEFGEGSLPGIFGVDYTYPTPEEVTYFAGKGMNVVRLPFRWERLQPVPMAPFDDAELARLSAVVDDATAQGVYVLLDPHNYARYFGDVVGSPALPVEAFTDFWSRLAGIFGNDPHVLFGLMNEPHDMATEVWLSDANAALAAIRAAGASNLVLVPGNGYTGAHAWADGWYGTPNSEVMDGVVDPAGNFAYELHQYLDADSSGTSPTCVGPSIGADRLVVVTDWLRQRGARGFLGEFAGSSDPTCLAALDQMLSFVEANDDVWIGWTYWAAGPWWGDDMFSLEPQGGMDRPQMAALAPHLPAP